MQALIDRLEHLAGHAIRIPVSGKILLDEAAVRRLVDELRAAARDELRTGQRIAGERDRILTEARAQARIIVDDAQSQANARLEEHNVVQAARQRAREIEQEAEKTAAALRADADHYVLNQFNLFEARLIRIVREVQAGQRALTQAAAKPTDDSVAS